MCVYLCLWHELPLYRVTYVLRNWSPRVQHVALIAGLLTLQALSIAVLPPAQA